MNKFIEFILREVSREELEKVGWFGVLARYSEDMCEKEEFDRMVEGFDRMVEELKKLGEDRFIGE